MNSLSKSKRWQKLQTKAYRDAYAAAQLSMEIPFQVRALRKARGWTQAQLAKRCGIPQARLSHIEQPGRDPLSLRTLYRLASAFDVGLLVHFVPFSELIHREAAFDPETFQVSGFEDDQRWTATVVPTVEHVQPTEMADDYYQMYQKFLWNVSTPESWHKTTTAYAYRHGSKDTDQRGRGRFVELRAFAPDPTLWSPKRA